MTRDAQGNPLSETQLREVRARRARRSRERMKARGQLTRPELWEMGRTVPYVTWDNNEGGA